MKEGTRPGYDKIQDGSVVSFVVLFYSDGDGWRGPKK